MVAAGDAVVSVFDHGLTVGDGVFETLKVIGGGAFDVRRHLERLGRSAQGLGLNLPLGDTRCAPSTRWSRGRRRHGPPASMAAGSPRSALVARRARPRRRRRAPGPVARRDRGGDRALAPQRAVGGRRDQDHVLRRDVVMLAEARKVGGSEATAANTRGTCARARAPTCSSC